MRAQNKPKPRWEIGAEPMTLGCHEIYAYGGYRKPTPYSRNNEHYYRSRCTRCGAEHTIRQGTIAGYMSKPPQKCRLCVGGSTQYKQARQKDINKRRYRERQAWIDLMMTWPITKASDRPDKLFDSECYRAAGCPVDVPDILKPQAD